VSPAGLLSDGFSPVLALGVAIVAILAVSFVRLLRKAAPARRHPARVQPFSYWYALVPFEDVAEAKERPVLVLRHDGVTARVLKVTSRPKPGRTDYRRIDTSQWDRPGRREGSWLQTDQAVTVPLNGFRRRLGDERNPHFQRGLRRLHPGELDET
jgi:hypothetical protein